MLSAAARALKRSRSNTPLLPAVLGSLLGAMLLLGAGGASAIEPVDSAYGALPEHFQYTHWYASPEQKPPSFSFERNQSRSVRAPTRYRTQSILRYETPLGRSGLILRIKAPLKQRKIVKFELRF